MNFGRQGHSDNDTQRLFDTFVSRCIAELRKEPACQREALLTHMTAKRDDAELVKAELFRRWGE